MNTHTNNKWFNLLPSTIVPRRPSRGVNGPSVASENGLCRGLVGRLAVRHRSLPARPWRFQQRCRVQQQNKLRHKGSITFYSIFTRGRQGWRRGRRLVLYVLLDARGRKTVAVRANVVATIDVGRFIRALKRVIAAKMRAHDL